MIRAILIDDEQSGLNTLQKLLQEYCPQVKVLAACDNASSALEKINQLDPQLVFLDISMPDKNGFELLSELKDKTFEIIFVTAHQDYMLQAFRYSAVDYLMKPVDEDKLIDAVQRAEARINAHESSSGISTLLHNLVHSQLPRERKLCIPSQKGFQVVDLKEILFCEASGNYTNIYFTDKRPICSAKPIHEYEEILSDASFVRIHKSYLVNLMHIQEYIRGEGGSVLLTNGKEIEVARRKKEYFLSRMKEFYKF